MKFAKSLVLVFAAAALTTACGSPEERQARIAAQEGDRAATLERLETSDAGIFRNAGFEIVSRTGMGYCNEKGEIPGTPFYSHGSTDLTYILKKADGGGFTYTACMVHSDGNTTMRGLKALETFAPAR